MSKPQRIFDPGAAMQHIHQRFAGAVLLEPGLKGSSDKIRNKITGRILPCCYLDCETDASTRFEVHFPHPEPRWPGEQRVYAFCGDAHKALWLKNTPYADRA